MRRKLIFFAWLLSCALLLPAREPVNVTLKTGGFPYWIFPGAEAPELIFTNTGEHDIPLNAKILLCGPSREKKEILFEEMLPPGKSIQKTLPGDYRKQGVWNIECTLKSNDRTRTWNGAFAVMIPAGNAPGRAPFVFGMNSHPSWAESEDVVKKEAEACGLIGVSALRDGSSWLSVEYAPGKWNFNRFDLIVEVFGKQNIEIWNLLYAAPQWAIAKDRKGVYPPPSHFRAQLPEYAAWETYIATTAEHYKGKIRYWEIWNEPDLQAADFPAPQYLELLQIAYRTLKKNDPGNVVLCGGLSPSAFFPNNLKGHFLPELLKSGQPHFDLLAWHDHNVLSGYRQNMKLFFELCKEFRNTKPWINNECGLHTTGRSDELQAQSLFKKFFYTWGEGSLGYFWYDLRNDGYDPKEPEHNFGMLTRDFYPKMSYVTFNTISTHFKNARLQQDLSQKGQLHAYLFQDGDTVLIPGWREDGNGALFITTDAKGAERIDLNGNVTELELHNGQLLLSFAAEPSIVRFREAGTVKAGGDMVNVKEIPIIPGRKNALELDVTNPLDTPQEFQFKLGRSVSKFILAARETRRITLPLAGDLESKRTVSLFYKLPDAGLRGECNILLKKAKIIPSQAHADPDFELADRSQRHELYDANPAMSHMTWRDPADSSAKVRFALSGDKLIFHAEVTDDKHAQPFEGWNVWKGDNLQLAFLFPEQAESWELGLSHLDNGTAEVFFFQKAEKNLSPRVTLTTSRDGTATSYHAEFPLRQFGISPEALKRQGFRFNLFVNDNDGDGRKGWLQILPVVHQNTVSQGLPASVPILFQ